MNITRRKQECPLEGKWRSENIAYKCVRTITAHPQRSYLETTEVDFKQQYNNHNMSFTNKSYANVNSLSK